MFMYSYCHVYVCLLSRLCMLIFTFMYAYCHVCSVVFIVPNGILRLPWLRFFRAFSSVVRPMPGKPRKDAARSAIFLISELCCSVYRLCVNVYCTAATRRLLNCSYIYHIISYHIIYHIIPYHITSHHITSHHIISYHIISYHIISYHIISYHIIYHIISYHIISYHIITHHIISYIISYHITSYHISYHINFGPYKQSSALRLLPDHEHCYRHRRHGHLPFALVTPRRS